jgi:alkylated DNA repair dioxygenase AlkB
MNSICTPSESSPSSLWQELGKNIEVIAPGLVFIKGALNQEQQIWLANYALKAGSDPQRGFWEVLPSGERVLNSDTGRGRIYDAITTFPDPEKVLELCHALVRAAQNQDSALPDMTPTHLLLLYYATADGMYWHSDSDKNDGDNNHPIVSISIGNSCDFGYKLMGRGEKTLLVESGDVLIWGGPNRLLLHSVQKVYMNTCPSFLPLENARLNFTFRDAPNVLGREKDFKYDVDSTYNQLLPHLLATVKPSSNNQTSNDA